MKLPAASLADLLSKQPAELNEIEAAVRGSIEALHTPAEVESMRSAATLDETLRPKVVAVGRVRKI